MAYRSGTYIAFDGLGQTNPTLSDFRFYATIKAWASNQNIDFKYVDSHDKTSAVRDTSQRSTLEARIRERLSNSKNVVVILSSSTRKSGSMLTYEIEQAVDSYELPLIVTYVDFAVVANPSALSSYWPNALSARIANGTAKAIHIPFVQGALLNAITTYNPSKLPGGSSQIFNEKAQRSYGCLTGQAAFRNTRKK